MQFLTAYPVATVSSLCAYVVFALLLIPATSRKVAPWLTTPASTISHLGAFDTIRGFAALLVAFSHFWWATYPIFGTTDQIAPWVNYGTKAVPIFAVLSGFLIYRSTAGIVNLPTLRAYIIRRIFRIFPVYVALLLIALPLGQFEGNGRQTIFAHFIAEVLMFYSVHWPMGTIVNPPAWSIYIEALFYVLLPLLVILFGRNRMPWVAALMVLLLVLAWTPVRLFGLWQFFAIGILASEMTHHFRKIAIPALAAGLVLLVIDFWGPAYDWGAFVHPYVQGQYMTNGLGLAMFLMLVSLPHMARLGRALDWLPFKVLGAVSYSVYLIQFFYLLANFPEIGLLRTAGTQYQLFKTYPEMPRWFLPVVFLPGVLFWGMVSFVLIEKPGMDLGRRLAKRVSGKA